MARKEAIFKATIDTGSSVNDVKNLDKELEGLNNELKDLTKNGQTNTQEFKDLSKAYEDTRNEVKKLAGDMEHLGDDIIVEVSGSISKMEDRLYDLAIAGKQNTQEFQELQQKTANYKKVIIETDRSIDALAERGKGLNTALSLSTGAVAGFQAFTGVTALLGDENEELLETITKLQAAQGVLNSIEVIKQQIQNNSIALTKAQTTVQKLYNLAVGNGSKAMKLFRGALLATGIGALVIGVGLLIANFDKLRKMVSGTTAEQDAFNQVTDTAIDKVGEELSASDKLQKTLRDQSISREDKVKAVKKLQTEYPNLLSNIDAEKDSLNDINDALVLNTKLTLLKAKQDAVASLRTEQITKQIKAQVDAQTGQVNGVIGFAVEMAGIGGVIDVTSEKQAIANGQSQEAIDLSKQQVGVLDELDASLQTEIDLIVESGGVSEKVTNTKVDNSKKIADAKKTENDRINQALLNQAEVEDALFKMKLTAQEKEEQAVTEKYDALFLKAEGNAVLEKQLIEQQENELNAIRKTHRDQDAIDKATATKTANDLRLSLMRDSIDKDIEISNDKFKRERESLAENMLLTAEEKLLLETEILEREKTELFDIEEKWREKGVDAEKKATDKKREIQKAYFDTINNGLNAVSDLNEFVTTLQMNSADGNAKHQEKIQRQNFNRAKVLNIAMATMSATQGVLSALAVPTTIPDPLGTVLKNINAVAVGISGAANVGKIAATKFKGGGSPSPSLPSGGGGGGGTGASASSFSIGDALSNVTDLNEDGTTSSSMTQVVVVETDITNAVNNVAQINEVAKF